MRPERLKLARAEEPITSNQITGTVEEVFFLGDHVRLSVALGAEQMLVARIPAPEARPFAVGETITLACGQADTHLLEREP